MVFSNVLCAINVASSLMLNGACCYYQMHEEEERKKSQEESIQRAIRQELDMREEQELQNRGRQDIISHFQAQRRRKLMSQKQASKAEGQLEDLRCGQESERQSPQQDSSSPLDSDYRVTARYDIDTSENQEYVPPIQAALSKSSAFSIGNQQRSELSSLMDEDLFLHEEDLEEIVLE